MPHSAGTRLGPYEILAPIGAGGMGEVYRARDPRLGRDVAIKVSKQQFTERFDREARAIAALNHPNICHIYDVGPNYLVMELVEGNPLKGPLPLEKAIEYAGQILDALDAAHQKGITHRDLKPANILVTKQGIKLLDFGLAKQAVRLGEDDSTKALTDQGQIVGTLQYMSPEQLQTKDIDARSDLFSFGCVLYEMVTGRRAFDGSSGASVIAAILEREPAPLDTTPPVERVVKACLAKDPDERIQTARDVKTALLWACEPLPDGVVISAGSRRWWIAIAAALVLGAGAAWGVAHFRQPTAAVDNRVIRFHMDAPEGSQFEAGPNIALSPDGKTVAYAASVKSKTALWVQPLDGAPRMLTATEGPSYPFWSPDSKSIAFFSGNKLMRVDLTGGAPLTICTVIQGRGGAWTDDGRIVYGLSGSPLNQVPASGGTPTPLTVLAPGEFTHAWPQMLPGGRFLYLNTPGSGHSSVYGASLAKPTERLRVLPTDFNALYAPSSDGTGYLLWLRGGTLVAQEFNPVTLKISGEPQPVVDPVASLYPFRMAASISTSGMLVYSSAAAPMGQFIWLDRGGRRLGILEPGDWDAYSIGLSPDGRRVAATRHREMWVLDIDRGNVNRFSFAPGLNLDPVWSPDGRTIVFSADKNNLFRKDSTGAGTEERLTQSEDNQYATDWSRDGRRIMYYEIRSNSKRDLWVLPVMPDGRLAPGSKPTPYLRSPSFNVLYGRFSPEPNPRWVAYESDESGRYEIYIQPFPSREASIRSQPEADNSRNGIPTDANCFMLLQATSSCR